MDQTCISCGFCISRQILYHWATWEAQVARVTYWKPKPSTSTLSWDVKDRNYLPSPTHTSLSTLTSVLFQEILTHENGLILHYNNFLKHSSTFQWKVSTVFVLRLWISLLKTLPLLFSPVLDSYIMILVQL